jgi:hypothetical protein
MSDPQSICPKCGSDMNRGHMPDYARGDVSARQAAWASGDPEPRRFQRGIKPRPDVEIPLSVFRCLRCGFLEFYAASAE